jgi:ribonuclease P protein component
LERYFLRKSQRLVDDDEFQRVLKHKLFICKGIMRLYAAPNGTDRARFGVSASNTCGSAVCRNRLKRLGREVFRLHQHEIPPGYDYILIFTQKVPKTNTKGDLKPDTDEAGRLQYQDIENRFLRMTELLRQQGGLGESKQ